MKVKIPVIINARPRPAGLPSEEEITLPLRGARVTREWRRLPGGGSNNVYFWGEEGHQSLLASIERTTGPSAGVHPYLVTRYVLGRRYVDFDEYTWGLGPPFWDICTWMCKWALGSTAERPDGSLSSKNLEELNGLLQEYVEPRAAD